MAENEQQKSNISNIKSSETRYRPEEKNSRWLYNYNSFYFRVKASLTGGWLSRNENNEIFIQYENDIPNPCINSIGLTETLSFISGWVTEIQGFTYFKEVDRILDLCRENRKLLVRFYRINMEKFELTPERASKIIAIVMDLYEANLRRSLKGRSLNIIGTTERTVVTKDDEKGKRKFLPL